MLISKNIKVKWSRSNCTHFKNLGYQFTEFGNEFEVSVAELSEGSNYSVKIKCDYCGEEFYRPYQKYLRGHKNNNYKDCCDNKKCKLSKTKETNLQIYGCENVFQNESIKEKIEQINIEKYGVKNPNQSREIRIKTEETNLKKYGYKSVLQNEEIKSKINKTNLQKYGFIHAMQNKEIQEKSRKNNPFRYSYDEIKCYIESNSGCKIITNNFEFESNNLNTSSKIEIECKCGKIFKTSFIEFKHCNKRQCNECGYDNVRGQNHYFWHGGKTSERQKDLRSDNYKEWRSSIFKRDNYTCRCCGNKSNHLEAHHLNNYMDFIELRYDIDNGITLCKECHRFTQLGSFHNLYGTFHNTKEQFEEYFQRYKNGEIDEIKNVKT